MKAMFSRKGALTAGVILFATATTYAGPGPQFWANLNKKGAQANDAKAAGTIPVCPGSKEVPVTVMKPAWANGRGPLTEVQIGTKRVCTVCPVTSATTTGWVNGRGPQSRTEETKSGAEHTCTVNCPKPKV